MCKCDAIGGRNNVIEKEIKKGELAVVRYRI